MAARKASAHTTRLPRRQQRTMTPEPSTTVTHSSSAQRPPCKHDVDSRAHTQALPAFLETRAHHRQAPFLPNNQHSADSVGPGSQEFGPTFASGYPEPRGRSPQKKRVLVSMQDLRPTQPLLRPPRPWPTARANGTPGEGGDPRHCGPVTSATRDRTSWETVTAHNLIYSS